MNLLPILFTTALFLVSCLPEESGDFNYVCENSMPTEGTTATENTEMCASCDDGSTPQNNVCINPDGNGEEFSFICTNGTVAGGMTPTANTQMCASCNCGYRLENDVCVEDTSAAMEFSLTSSESEEGFAPDGTIPNEFLSSENFPKLSWSGVPCGTGSLVLIVEYVILGTVKKI